MREELRYLLQNVFDCKIKKKYVDPAIDILAFKHKLMTKTIVYSMFTVQAMIIKPAAQFHDHLLAVLKKEVLDFEDKVIIGGVLNCPMNRMLDNQGGIIMTRKKIVERVEEIQITFKLHDIWRFKTQRKKFHLVPKISIYLLHIILLPYFGCNSRPD